LISCGIHAKKRGGRRAGIWAGSSAFTRFPDRLKTNSQPKWAVSRIKGVYNLCSIEPIPHLRQTGSRLEMNTPITVAIVEDNRGTREGLVELLGRAPNLQCVGAYGSGEDAVRELPARQPKVVLMDINLPGMSGVECVARLKECLPQSLVLMLTTYEESDLIFASLRAGASGYLLKNMHPAELTQAVEQVHSGGAPMSMQIARKVVNHFQQIKQPASEMEKLTKRELEILTLLAKGYLYKEIGEHLGITLSTVRAHLHTIYEKLHVQSRTQAVLKFLER
jgi:DNA-binding NarL/FixJ family response regulator